MPLPELLPRTFQTTLRYSGTLFPRWGLTGEGLSVRAFSTDAKKRIDLFRRAVLTQTAEDIADGKVEAAAADIETTGKKRRDDPTGLKIFEAAISPITSAGGKPYHQYYDPKEPIDSGLLSCHGMTSVEGLPTFKQDWPRFKQALPKTGILIFHNTPGVDSRALASELAGIKAPSFPALPLFCSQAMATLLPYNLTAKAKHPGQLSLRALAALFDANPHGPWHSAQTDANVLARITPELAEAVAREQQDQAHTFALARAELAEMTGEELIQETLLANPKLINAKATVLSLAKFGLFMKPTVQARTTKEVEAGPLFDQFNTKL